MTSSPNQGGVYTVASVLMFASTIAVGFRFKVRRMKQAPLGWDDLFIGVSLLLVYALALILIVGAARGTIGTHTSINPVTHQLITTRHEVDVSMLAFVSQMFAIATYGTLKLSVLLLYRRIFIGPIFRHVSLAMITLVAIWVVSFFFATLFQCGRNPEWFWQSSAAVREHCSDYKYIQLGHASSDVATDLMVLATPLPMIWRLHMSTIHKISLTFIFLLGLIATAAGTARLVFVAEDLYETTTGARDLRGVQTNVMVWSFVEAGVGVIAACLPTFKPLLSKRTVESIVNSVRSKLSLNSLGSSNRHGSDVEQLSRTTQESYEMQPNEPSAKRVYGDEISTVQTQIEHADMCDKDLPEDRILVESGVVRQEDRRGKEVV